MTDSQALGTIANLLIHHWHICLMVWLVYCGINAMPSPNGSGASGSLLYKWIFGTTHAFVGGIPRLLAIFLPNNPVVQKVLQTGSYPVVDPKAKGAGA